MVAPAGSTASTAGASRSQEHLEKGSERPVTPNDLPLEEAARPASALGEAPAGDAASPFLGKPMSLPREVIFLLLVTSSQLLTQAGLGQNIAPLHLIGDSYGVSDAGQLSWTAAAYSLTVGACILIAGRLGDVYGHRRLFVIGYLWFCFGSLGAGLSSFAPTIIPFDVFRAVQGIGPALLLPNSLAILGRTYRNGPRKALAFGLYGACAPSGFIVGATFASLLAERVGWQWAYYLMAILCAGLAAGTLLVIPADKLTPPRLSLKDASRTLDLPGALLGVLGLCFVNFAFNQAPLVGWATSYVLVFLILGLLLLVGFLILEPRVAHPILPYHNFSGSTTFVLACIVGGWGSFGVWTFYFYQQYTLEGASGLLITARAAPVCFAGLVAGLATAALFHRLPPSVLLLISMFGFFVGSAVMAFRPAYQIYWGQAFVSTLLTPFGMDISFPASTLILSNSMPTEHQGLAASIVATFVNYSISIGLGIAGTVEVHTSRDGTDVQRGFRGATISGVIMAGIAVCTAAAFCVSQARHSSRTRRAEKEKEVQSEEEAT